MRTTEPISRFLTSKLPVRSETSEISVFQISLAGFLPADIYNTVYRVGVQGKFKKNLVYCNHRFLRQAPYFALNGRASTFAEATVDESQGRTGCATRGEKMNVPNIPGI
jgi:hypothetical protein